MILVDRLLRQSCGVIVAILACMNAYGSSTNALIQSAGLEKLMFAAAQAETNITSRFVLSDLPGDGWVEAHVARRGYLNRDIGNYSGCVAVVDNRSSGTFVLTALPPSVQGLSIDGGRFDLSGMRECPNVRWLFADCEDLNVNVQGLCRRFPLVEAMSLEVSRLRDNDVDIDSLSCLQRLKRLKLNVGTSKIPVGDLTRKLIRAMPHLERLHVMGTYELGVIGKGWTGEKASKNLDLSACMTIGETCVVVIPDGDFTGCDVTLSSPNVRFLRFHSGNKKLYSLYLHLSNVIPQGETDLVENGFIVYSIRISKCEGEGGSVRGTKPAGEVGVTE